MKNNNVVVVPSKDKRGMAMGRTPFSCIAKEGFSISQKMRELFIEVRCALRAVGLKGRSVGRSVGRVGQGSLRWGIVGATDDPSKIARGREGRVNNSAVARFGAVRETRKDQATKRSPAKRCTVAAVRKTSKF
jgi:hypothetical protein